MHLPMLSEFNLEHDLKHRIRDMRFFEASFRRNVTLTLGQLGLRSKTDQARLRSSFLAWLEDFQSNRHFAEIDRRDFICFSAGRMLAELLRHDPLTLVAGLPAEPSTVEHWPTGSAYVSYCLGVALSVMAQELPSTPDLSDRVTDPRIWHSFRENVHDNPDLAIPFLDLLLGQSPNWIEPRLADKRPAMLAQSARALSH